MGGYAPEVVRIANKTIRDSGAVGRDPLVYRFAMKVLDPDETVLDYGAGPKAIHTAKLRLAGIETTAWDFGDNFVEGVHDPDALDKFYDTVLVSNVFNVLSEWEAILLAIREILSCLKDESRVVWNYPVSPRKCEGRSAQSIVAEFADHGFMTVSPHAHLFVSGIPAFLRPEK